MSKWKKIVGGVIVVVVVIAIALIVIANMLITPERVKATVLPLVEDALHRKVELGEIEISLFSGIELQGLRVYEADGTEVFVSTELVRLKYQLLPLLAMKVVIDEVRLEQPRIRVVRLQGGQFNFSDLTAEQEGEESHKELEESAERDSGMSLLVSSVAVTDGQLVFLDHTLNAVAPYRYEVAGLQMTAQGVTLTGKIPVKAECTLNGARLGVDGDLRLKDSGGAFHVTLQGLDLMAFKPYFADAIPGRLDGMMLSVDANLDRSFDTLTAVGGLQVTNLDLLLEALPEAPIADAQLGLNFDVSVEPDQVEMRKMSVDYNGLVADLGGRIAQLQAKPTVDIDLSMPGIELRKVMSSVPRQLVEGMADLDPAGVLVLQAKLTGTLDQPAALLKSAQVTLDKVQANTNGVRPSLSGSLALEGDRLTSQDLTLRLGDNKALLNLAASNIFNKPIVATLDVTSEKFLLDPLLKGGAGGAAAVGGGDAQQAAKAEELGPFDLPLRASGTLRVAETLWKGLDIRNFVAKYVLKNNVLEISQMEGQVAGGSFANSARVDLGQQGLVYEAKLGIKTIQADPLLKALLPKAAGTLLGAMNLDLAVKGKGTQWETLSRQLTGQGDLLLADGRVTSPGLVKGFASFLQLSEMNEIAFKNFQGNVKIANGKLLIDSGLLSSKLKMFPKGEIGLDGSLNLSLDTRLSPETAARLDQRGKVTRFLTDKDGWSQVPLLLTGDFSRPRFGLDPAGVKAQATKALGGEVERQIDKLLKKQQPQHGESETKPQEQEDPTQKLLKDSLKNLFGN